MKQSAGILVYRLKKGLEVFLVHPGGPYWKGKDTGAWSIPKGEFVSGEEALVAAQREFREETGQMVEGHFRPLTPVKLKSGKIIYCWAVEAQVDETSIVSNQFKVEWPYKSGRWQDFPEVDKAGWFRPAEATEKVNPAQAALITELQKMLEEEKAG
jgi:predicted NUDIX family NTP pyrophosphohydrolase